MASFAEPDLPLSFGASDPLLPPDADDHLDAYAALTDPSNLADHAAAASDAQIEQSLFGDEPPPASTASFAAPVPSRNTDLLRESVSRAASREHSHSIGHPHSLFGATPYSSSPVASGMHRDIAHAVSAPWGEMSISAGTALRTLEPEREPEPENEPLNEPEPEAEEPFGFQSPTQLSADEHLAVDGSDVDMHDESDEPEVPETSLPSVQDEEEEQTEQVQGQEEAILEEETIEEEAMTRDRLEYSARAASVILGEDTRAVLREEAQAVFESAPNANGFQVPQDVEEAIVDEEEIEPVVEAAEPIEQATEDNAEEEQPEAAIVTKISTFTTVERVPLKRSIDEIPADDPEHTAKRRRRRSFAEVLEADAQSFIAGLGDRSQRHASVAASVAPETPSKKPREKGTATTPRSRGRPRKTDATPSAKRAKSMGPITPRRRGRPPKAATGATPTTTTKPAVSTGKKRGRPSLASQGLVSPTKPRSTPASTGRRGRPRKNTVTTTAEANGVPETVTVLETPASKRRGRPPKQKPTAEAAANSAPAVGANASDELLEAPTLAGVERPKKQPQSRIKAAVSRAASARSKGGAAAAPAEERSEGLQVGEVGARPGRKRRAEADEPRDEPAADVAEAAAPEPAPKRRGRPPKATQAKLAAASDANKVDSGKGKETKCSNARTSRGTASVADTGATEETAASAAPRRRGRPRKV
jgi:hypothetical protein